MSPIGTRARLLDEGEALIRRKGYSAFSYADLAARVGISKASIHHHFPTKGDLGQALVDGYIDRFGDLLRQIENDQPDAAGRLRAYGAIYATAVENGMLCLCGVLAAESAVLPEALRARVRTFFDRQTSWLAKTIAQGKAAGCLRSDVQPERAATHVLSAFQGAAVISWAKQSPEVLDAAIADVVHGLTA